MKHLDRMFDLAPEAPAGGGGSGTDEPGQNTDNPAGDLGSETGELEGLELTPEQQAKYDLVLTKRLERERDKWAREVEAARDKAKKEAEETRLAEQQQFQELANRRQSTIEEQAGRIQELEQMGDKVKKYEKALTVYRDALIANVSEPIKALLKPMDVADQLAWLSANAQELGDGERGYVGPPPAPGGKGKNGGLTPEQKRKKAYLPTNF